MIKILFILAACVLAISLLWRVSSNRWVLPCPSWLSWMIELDNPLAPLHKAQEIVKNLQITPGMNVLDVGCGPGRVTIPLAQAVGSKGRVMGVDLQAEMIEKARTKATQFGLQNIDFSQGSFDQLSLENHAFDRIVMVAVLGEIPHPEMTFHQAYKVLKSGGWLSISELIFDPHFQTKHTVRKLAEDAGFKELQAFGPWYAYTINFVKS